MVRELWVFPSGGICGSRSAFRGAKRDHSIFHARVGLVRFPSKVVHSGASKDHNVITLFFILRWHRYGFDKKRASTSYAKLVFSHPVGSVGHVVHYGEQNVIALFFMLEWDQYGFDKKRVGTR
jgi:hypothetical protein